MTKATKMAPRNTSIALGEPLNAFIAAQVESGRYGSASEVVRTALRLLQERETNFAALSAALDEGLKSPVVEDFSLLKLLKEIDGTG